MKRAGKLAIDYAAYVVVRAFLCVVQALPLETCEAWATRFAWALWHVARLRRGVIEENLGIAFPRSSPAERERIALSMWRHLVVMIAEIAHAPRKLHRTNWRQHSSFPDMQRLARQLLDRRPTIFISAHLGNFEMGGYLLGLHGFETYTIARTLDNKFLDRWINNFRGATGQHILSKQGSGGEIQRVLGSGGTLVLLGDQNAGRGGLWVDFFGKTASTHKAVALFTLGAEAPTAVCAALRTGRALQFEMLVADLVDPLDGRQETANARTVTEWYTGRLEELIRRAPGQYWWVHRRWKGEPKRRRGHTLVSQAAA